MLIFENAFNILFGFYDTKEGIYGKVLANGQIITFLN